MKGLGFQVLACSVVPIKQVKQWHVRARDQLGQSLTKLLINTVKSTQ